MQEQIIVNDNSPNPPEINPDLLTVYGAMWCPDCRRSKQFLGEQRVQYNWVDLEAYPAAMETVRELQHGSQSIPTLRFPDGSVLVEPSNAELAAKLGINTRAQCPFYDVIMVGGGPAGLTAALYLARDGYSALVVDKAAPGGQAGTTEQIDNYPGFVDGISGDQFAKNVVAQAKRFGVEMLGATNIAAIGIEGEYRTIRTTSGDEYSAHVLLLATGSNYRRLGLSNEGDYTGAGVHYCATCDGPFYKGKQVAVVGGGNSATEESIFLLRFVDKVTILVRGDRFTASKLAIDKVNRLVEEGRMAVRFNSEVAGLQGSKHLERIVIRDRETGTETTEDFPALFVYIGLDPNTAYLRAPLEANQQAGQEQQSDTVMLTAEGFIATDSQLRTNIPGIFAAGDVRAASTKQVASAVGEGATAALMIREYLNEQG